MGSKRFSNQAVGPPGLEQQQAILMGMLRRAGGDPVSYSELRDAGIEFPAGVVSELTLAGVAIERCHASSPSGQKVLGVRLVADDLDPAEVERPGPTTAASVQPERPAPTPEASAQPERAGDPAAAAAKSPAQQPAESGWDTLRVYRTSPLAGARAHRPGRRVAVPAALLAIVGLVAVILVIGVTSGGGAHPRPPVAAHRTARRTVAATSAHATPSHSAPPSAPQSPSTPVSPALATQLESRGHSLIEDGQYASAVPVLKGAVSATGERLDACLEPDSSTCLTYAYALYDLGVALRQSGHPGAAVPVLERRLQIDNQRPTVQAQLQLALQNVG